MRSYSYNLQRLRENEIAGQKTANALIDFCLGMNSTSKYLILNPNGRGSVNFDFDEGGLLADIASMLGGLGGGYDGPFKMTTTGVGAGYVIVPGGSIINVQACEYAQMTQHATGGGLVQLIIDGSGSNWSYSWHIARSYLVFDNCWTIIVGSWTQDTGAIVQRFFGDAYIYAGGSGSEEEYSGPFKLSMERNGDSWSLSTNGGDIYNLEPYSGSASVPVASISPETWSLPSSNNGQVVVLRITSSGFQLSMVEQGYTAPANEIARIGMAWPVYVEGALDHWEVLQEYQWGKSDVYWHQGYSFSQERLLSESGQGLYLCLYMGDFGCWPVSATEVYFKGGTLTRRFGGSTGATTTTTIPSQTYTVSTNGVQYLSLLPYQRGGECSGLVTSFTSTGIITVSLAVLADLSVSSGRISVFRPYAFREGKGLNSKTSVVNYVDGRFLLETASLHLEPYDDSNVVFYWWDSGSQYQIFPVGTGVQELHWASANHSSDISSEGLFQTSGDSGSGIGGYTTRLAHWQAYGSSRLTWRLYDDYSGSSGSYQTTIDYFGVGWRAAGDILLSGGRIDCGWQTLPVNSSTMSAPTSSEYVWLSVTYAVSQSSTGTLTATWGHGASLPSSTASTQVIELAKITVSSSGVVRITPQGGFPGVDNGVLARYCQVFICGRCL